MTHKTVSKDVKKLLAEIVDRCDNSLCNIPSTHPKHRAMFDLFKELANVATSIAGEGGSLMVERIHEQQGKLWQSVLQY